MYDLLGSNSISDSVSAALKAFLHGFDLSAMLIVPEILFDVYTELGVLEENLPYLYTIPL